MSAKDDCPICNGATFDAEGDVDFVSSVWRAESLKLCPKDRKISNEIKAKIIGSALDTSQAIEKE